MVNMTRGALPSDLTALIDLVRDPDVYEARLTELNEATEKSTAAIAEAKTRFLEAGERLNAVNAREVILVRGETALAADQESLAADREKLKAETDAANSALAAREAATKERERAAIEREQAVAKAAAELATAQAVLAADQATARNAVSNYEAKAAALRAIICPEG